MGSVIAIVPAAGESRRMGSLKPLLPYGNSSVLRTVVSSLQASPVDRVLVVLGHRSDEIAAHLEGSGAEIVLNADYRLGMLSSIQAGVRAAPDDFSHFVIALGDQPSLSPTTARLLIQTAGERHASIVVPSYNGRRGHPLVLDACFRKEILGLDPGVGLRELLQRHPDAIHHVLVPDEAVLSDMDTPQDYERELKRLEK
jgi:molybdenum cofactor cytidylyltransferase